MIGWVANARTGKDRSNQAGRENSAEFMRLESFGLKIHSKSLERSSCDAVHA
jgi:hypothetical protein